MQTEESIPSQFTTQTGSGVDVQTSLLVTHTLSFPSLLLISSSGIYLTAIMSTSSGVWKVRTTIICFINFLIRMIFELETREACASYISLLFTAVDWLVWHMTHVSSHCFFFQNTGRKSTCTVDQVQERSESLVTRWVVIDRIAICIEERKCDPCHCPFILRNECNPLVNQYAFQMTH